MTRQLDRREFLDQILLLSAAALAAPAVAGPSGSQSANERLRVAVLGVNGRGKSHLSAFSKFNDTEVAIVCDPDERVGQAQAEKVKNQSGTAARYVKDLRAVMDDKSIDIVAIATPNHWHALASIWAMQAGKDVYVEKPVSHNVSEGRRIVQAARKYHRICQTGTQSRSSEAIAEAMAYLRSGKIGELKIARGLCYKLRPSIGKVEAPQPVPKHIDYNLWCGPAPMSPVMRRQFHYDWHWQWDYGNGDLGNQGIHQMDIARWALGVNRLADSVVSIGGRFGYVDDGQTPNTEITFLQYGDKQLIFEVRGLASLGFKMARGVGNVIHCTDGFLAIGSNYGEAVICDPEGKPIKVFKGGENHFRNFVDAVRSRKATDLKADIEEGHLSSALCHLGNISYRLGSPCSFADAEKALAGNDAALETLDRTKVHLKQHMIDLAKAQVQVGPKLKIQPATERFVGNAEADALLTREYRSPFEVPDVNRL